MNPGRPRQAVSARAVAAPDWSAISAASRGRGTALTEALLRALDLHRWALGVIGLAIFAFALRFLFADAHSAFMDEGTNVLTGRLLIEEQTVNAEILNWAYGSYLWPLIAGVADMAGGLLAVRMVTAVCGALMALATALAAYRLAPPGTTRSGRQAVALLAGTAMALAPTAIAVGRFGSYDALAAAGFMLGVSLLLPVSANPRGLQLLAAATLLLVAFLSKYLVAVYFPLICLYLMFSPLLWTPRRVSAAVRHLVWFVVPLTAACLGYLLVFLGPLLTLLTSSLSYGDLKSDGPLHEYVWTRPEIWLLVGAAALGWRSATPAGRLIAVVGAGVITGFQLVARPDFDFWKHSIYVIYFLAPLAALNWLKVPQSTGTWRVVRVAVVAFTMAWFSPGAETAASETATFYPNLKPSLDALETHAHGAAQVLMDDTAVRYYLYGKVPMDGLVGPFSFIYQGQNGMEAYRSAIYDYYFDVIVLDGGVTPQGAAIKQQLGQAIDANYTRVHSANAGHRFTVDIYRPRSARDGAGRDAAGPWPIHYTFDTDAVLESWGGRPEGRELQPGRHVTMSGDQLWNGRPSLQFTISDDVSMVTMRDPGTVSAVRAHVYLLAANESRLPIRIGMVGFDADWAWRDDGYRWLVPPGTWTMIKWQLARPGTYHEIGLSFPKDVRVAYVGDVEIDP